jgi:DNA-binding SARP family transcriptional activator
MPSAATSCASTTAGSTSTRQQTTCTTRSDYGPWTLRQRDRIRDLHLYGRQCLAEARALMGDYERSAQAAEVALTLDPYREAIYQRLIRSRALAGDRIAAASVFHRYRKLIESELGIEPSPETIATFQDAIGAQDNPRT